MPHNGAREKGLADEGDLVMGLACLTNEHEVGPSVPYERTCGGVWRTLRTNLAWGLAYPTNE